MTHATRRTRSARRATSLVASFTILAAALGLDSTGLGTEPAGAHDPPFQDLYDSYAVQVSGDYQPITGDFDCDGATDEIIWYAPGPTPDYHWDITGTTGGQLQYTSRELGINGHYEPFTIPYDRKDGCIEDVFWYAPGPAPDYIWDIDTPGGFGYDTLATPVHGDYTPVFVAVGLTGLESGIYWYAPGTATDYVWTLTGNGTHDGWVPPQVSGHYQPVSAQNAQGDIGILWYAPGTAQDHYWRGIEELRGSPVQDFEVTVNGTYQAQEALPGLLLYGPGRAPDTMISHVDEATQQLETRGGTVNGVYTLGQGLDDDLIVWHRPGPGRDHIWIRS